MKNCIVITLIVFLLCGCATFKNYGDAFKDAVLPVLVAQGAKAARSQVKKMVKDGDLTEAQAEKIYVIIDGIVAHEIKP